MSVSFSVYMPIIGWVIECSCGEATSGAFGTYADAAEALQNGLIPQCGDEFCAAYPARTSAVEEESVDVVNMSNINAKHILTVLGFIQEGEESDLSGTATGADLMGRILMAQAINPTDEGTATIVEGNSVFCGRPEGYTDERLAQIQDIARFAMDNNKEVVWS